MPRKRSLVTTGMKPRPTSRCSGVRRSCSPGGRWWLQWPKHRIEHLCNTTDSAAWTRPEGPTRRTKQTEKSLPKPNGAHEQDRTLNYQYKPAGAEAISLISSSYNTIPRKARDAAGSPSRTVALAISLRTCCSTPDNNRQKRSGEDGQPCLIPCNMAKGATRPDTPVRKTLPASLATQYK